MAAPFLEAFAWDWTIIRTSESSPETMINYDGRYIFVHIPKTGGTSVEDALWGPDWDARTERELWMGMDKTGRNKYQTGGLQHLLARQIRQEVGRDVFDDFFKFSFVRNPWDRVVSQFLYMKKRRDLRKLIGMRRRSSLSAYLHLIRRTAHVQWDEQWRFVLDEDGERIVDFVGRFENLQRDFQTVTAKLAVTDVILPHAKKSRRSHYADYYDQESREMVADMFRRDIDVFGYSWADSRES